MDILTSQKSSLTLNQRSSWPGSKIRQGCNVLCLLAALLAASARAETVKLVATQNAQIDVDAPNTPFLDWGILEASKSRSTLLQFDLAAIPPGASLTSAKLRFFSRAPLNYAYSALQEIWRVENDSWNQSTVTWNNFNGGAVDYLAVLGGGVGQHYLVWELDLNAWNEAVDLADGKLTLLVMRGAGAEYIDNGMSYYSRQVPNPNNGSPFPDAADIVPYLEITYTGDPPVIPPPVIQLLARTNDQLTLVWNTFPGWKYQLQSCAALATTNWTACTGTNYACEPCMTNTILAGPGSQNFFRVLQLRR